MTKLYYDEDADLKVLDGKTIAVYGYGSQGHAQANNMKDSGLSVIIALREDSKNIEIAQKDGFEVYTFKEAAKKADILHFLLPDTIHVQVFEQIKEEITNDKILACSHGINFHYNLITPPDGVDVIMLAPKAPGPTVRREFLAGFGVPALVAVHTNASGKALSYALAMAKAGRHTKPGCFETSFKDETETDLFGEQNVLCGGAAYLVKTGFEVLTEAGYPPEIAYFECLHELKLIVDLMYSGGIYGMSKKISSTARFGQFAQGPNIITDEVKKAMKESLKKIQNGDFVKEWIDIEYKKNKEENLKKNMAECHEWEVERIGRKIRQVAGLEEVTTGEE